MTKKLLILALVLPGSAYAAEILDPSFGPDGHGAAVSVERDRHFGTNRLPAYIFVDGKAVATLKGGEAVILRMSPGPHVMGSSLRNPPTAPDKAMAVEATEGKTTMLKAHLGNWGWTGMELQRVE